MIQIIMNVSIKNTLKSQKAKDNFPFKKKVRPILSTRVLVYKTLSFASGTCFYC